MTIRTYAQFYGLAVNSDKLIEACGDRAVIIIDGRTRRIDMLRVAKEECIKRKYEAFQLRRGEFRAHGDTELSPVIAVRDYNTIVRHLVRTNSL